MKRTIWKYELNGNDRQVFNMPRGAEILTVQVQAGKPCIWALGDPNVGLKGRLIELVGTGHQIINDNGDERKYIGTYQLSGGALVVHVFEIV